jgi:hypothetical protein
LEVGMGGVLEACLTAEDHGPRRISTTSQGWRGFPITTLSVA